MNKTLHRTRSGIAFPAIVISSRRTNARGGLLWLAVLLSASWLAGPAAAAGAANNPKAQPGLSFTTEKVVSLQTRPEDLLELFNAASNDGPFKRELTVARVSVTTDLNPVFNALMDAVISSAANITTDSGEWASYAALCSAAKTGGLKVYIDHVKADLWTTGLDQSSWTLVKQAAQKADAALAAGNAREALRCILVGFNAITHPSHNDWAWDRCKAVGAAALKPGA